MFYAEYLNDVISLRQELAFFFAFSSPVSAEQLIGFERTSRLKQAGIRTHCIIACTAAVMMIVSKYSFADLTDSAGIFFPEREVLIPHVSPHRWSAASAFWVPVCC